MLFFVKFYLFIRTDLILLILCFLQIEDKTPTAKGLRLTLLWWHGTEHTIPPKSACIRYTFDLYLFGSKKYILS